MPNSDLESVANRKYRRLEPGVLHLSAMLYGTQNGENMQSAISNYVILVYYFCNPVQCYLVKKTGKQ